MSYRKIYLNEFSANDLDWNLNIEGTLNYVLGISKQGWFNARNRIAENILPAVLQENGVIYFEVTIPASAEEAYSIDLSFVLQNVDLPH